MRQTAAAAVVADWRRWLWVFVLAAGAEAALLGTVATRRAVNADEGFYLAAAQQVLAGRHLYGDHFFPQMPYLPYAEAAVLAFSGPSLLAGRFLSVAAGALLAGILVVAAARRSGALRVGVAMGLLYAGNALLLSYVPIAKPYACANLALVSGFLLLVAPAVSPARACAAGMCAGLAVGFRLPAAAAVLVLLAWSMRHGTRQVLAFGVGTILAASLWLWLAARDPQSFWFCNFGFHELRREITGAGPILKQKAGVLAKWVLLPQNLLLWALALDGLRRRPGDAFPAIACAAALAAAYLAATPTYLEYVVQLAPFLLIAAIPAIAALLTRRAWTAAAAGLYVVGLLAARRAAPETSARGEKAQLWRLSTVRATTTYLRDHSDPGDRILSWWEGYPFLADRVGFRGVGFWESNMAKKLSPEARRRYHVLAEGEVRELIETRQPQLIVFPDGTWERLRGTINERYRAAARFGEIQVFARQEPAVAAPAPTSGAD